MREKIKSFFEKLNIEYFGILSYADCRETSERIRENAGFMPRSVIVYLLPYYTGECVNISRYAASVDYHIAIKEINLAITEFLLSEFPESKVQGYGDHSPIDERHAALILGLGKYGESGLILNEKYGSYIFIGDIVTDIPPQELSADAPKEILHCEACGLCKSACPTGVLRGEDCDCLSAITQRKGELSDEEKELIRKYNTAWGCDVCQSVCPYNKNPKNTPLEFFYRERIGNLTRELLSSMDKAAFERRAFAWRGRKTVERNLDILSQENIDA